MLTIIEIKDREDGGHGLQSQSHRTECWLEGWLAVPPELEQTAWDCAGYCDLDIQDGKLVGLTPREQPPKPEPEPDLTPQFRTAMLSYAATSTAIPDSYALDMSDLFPTWAAVLADGEELPEGRVLNDGGQLYRVVQAVGQLTKRPDITYFDYIEDISCNPLAARVKAAEIRDNLDAVRVNKMSFCTFSLEERAQKALKLLEHC